MNIYPILTFSLLYAARSYLRFILSRVYLYSRSTHVLPVYDFNDLRILKPAEVGQMIEPGK